MPGINIIKYGKKTDYNTEEYVYSTYSAEKASSFFALKA
jgi:hypothetical protein